VAGGSVCVKLEERRGMEVTLVLLVSNGDGIGSSVENVIFLPCKRANDEDGKHEAASFCTFWGVKSKVHVDF